MFDTSPLQAKSQTNLGGSDKITDLPSSPAPARCKRERSLSVNSYLLSPSHALSPPHTPQYLKNSSLNQSPRNSPRNFSLPANKLYFFPSNFPSDFIPISRRTSENSDNSSRTPLSSRTSSPTPNVAKNTSFYNFKRRLAFINSLALLTRPKLILMRLRVHFDKSLNKNQQIYQQTGK